MEMVYYNDTLYDQCICNYSIHKAAVRERNMDIRQTYNYTCLSSLCKAFDPFGLLFPEVQMAHYVFFHTVTDKCQACDGIGSNCFTSDSQSVIVSEL